MVLNGSRTPRRFPAPTDGCTLIAIVPQEVGSMEENRPGQSTSKNLKGTTIVAKKVRIGVIGTGGIANGAHLPGYSQIPDECEIYALCDIDPKPLQSTAAKYPDVKHLLDDHRK